MSCLYELKCEAHLVTQEGSIRGACTVNTMVDYLSRLVPEPADFDQAIDKIILSDTEGNCVQSDVSSVAGQGCNFTYRI